MAELGLVLQSIGTRQAILQTVSGEAISEAAIATLENNGAIATVQPVMAAPAGWGSSSTGAEKTLLFTDGLIVLVDKSLSAASRQVLWQRIGIDDMEPFRFAENLYLIKDPELVGSEIMETEQQLEALSGVINAGPNFVQATALSAAPLTAVAIVPETAPASRFQSANLTRVA